jgi:hypothetical protein
LLNTCLSEGSQFEVFHHRCTASHWHRKYPPIHQAPRALFHTCVPSKLTSMKISSNTERGYGSVSTCQPFPPLLFGAAVGGGSTGEATTEQCSGGRVIPHSNRATVANQCAGALGVRCPFTCDDGFWPVGEHVCQTYRVDGSVVINASFFGGTPAFQTIHCLCCNNAVEDTSRGRCGFRSTFGIRNCWEPCQNRPSVILVVVCCKSAVVARKLCEDSEHSKDPPCITFYFPLFTHFTFFPYPPYYPCSRSPAPLPSPSRAHTPAHLPVATAGRCDRLCEGSAAASCSAKEEVPIRTNITDTTTGAPCLRTVCMPAEGSWSRFFHPNSTRFPHGVYLKSLSDRAVAPGYLVRGTPRCDLAPSHTICKVSEN